MKKSILAVAGLAAVAGVAAPVAGAFATAETGSTQTDTLSVKIENNCALSYGTSAHTNGEGSWGTETGTKNTLSYTIENGAVSESVGTTNLSVTCNDTGGSYVALAAESLTNSTSDTITYAGNKPVPATASTWGVKSSSTGYTANNGNVWESSSASGVSGETFSVTYAVGVSATQEAGTYTGTAAYTLNHPKN